MKLFRFILIFSVPYLSVFAQNTEIKYLSGTGADNTVEWKFFCSAGMNSGKWTTIAVPSCWEQQGFGAYNFGREELEGRLNETGTYKYQFIIPPSWKNKSIDIVFEGVMTDAEVKINGKPAGPIHQGSFYPFKYNINHLIRWEHENELEVFVKKHSDNMGINESERHADYWVFGGIFRPVYLVAKPIEHIDRVAIDAHANGDFQANVHTLGIKNTVKVAVEIRTLEGKTEARFESWVIDSVTQLYGRLSTIKTWSPEFPNLYDAVFILLDKHNLPIHQVSERIGFRTIKVCESDGIYLNGVRIKMKGVCRHTFHPTYGRTSCKAFSTADANLIKDMNMNAVRMSHYPPERHFLDVCDSIGLLVVNEFTAWPEPPPGSKLARDLLAAMITRDMNHPSVILWANGNEGRENRNLDDYFAELDIQTRKVLHPWQDYDLINTLHYIDYNYLSLNGFSQRKIFLPTEFLHALYDGGGGAGLDDFWQKMWNEPLSAGGFLWAFADESLERTDNNNQLDSKGNYAPDGILGPYHEKEGSFFTIREIWSPVYFEKRYIIPNDFDGIFNIENRYFFTNLNQCSFIVEWIKFPAPNEDEDEEIVRFEYLKINLSPGQKGLLKITLTENWETFDALRIKMVDPHGRGVNTWTWPIKCPKFKVSELLHISSLKKPVIKPVIKETSDMFIIKVGELNFAFSKINGSIHWVKNQEQAIPISNGPIFVSGKRNVKQVAHHYNDNDLLIEIFYDNGDCIKWTVRSNGLLDLGVTYDPGDNCLFAGITFDFPEENIGGMKWLGNGPYRVYKNRMKGTAFGVWEKTYNNTITGESEFIYPEFKGYHAGIYWVKIFGKNVPDFTVFVHNNDIFFRMLTPQKPKYPLKGSAIDYPMGDLSFLHGINAIGTKFKVPEELGPQSFPYYFNPVKIHERKLNMMLTFDFRINPSN